MNNQTIDFLNSFLATTPYHLGYIDSNMVIFDSDESIISKAALIPIDPEEFIFQDGSITAHIYATSYRKNEYLPYVEIKGCLNSLDILYHSWGLHQFPKLSKKEISAVLSVFSELALVLNAKKIYNFIGGWINDDTLLIKNLLIKPSSIEHINNNTVKQEVILI